MKEIWSLKRDEDVKLLHAAKVVAWLGVGSLQDSFMLCMSSAS
jgi:hypothetical protein